MRNRPDLKTVSFRGNVQTRLKKLQSGIAHATFLASAGLNRLGLADKITCLMSLDEMLPAVAQGAIGLQINGRDDALRSLLALVNHRPTESAVNCERGFMAALNGSCRTPIAGHAVIENGVVNFRGEALTLDGEHVFKATRSGAISDATRMGLEAGEEVKLRGGSLIAY